MSGRQPSRYIIHPLPVETTRLFFLGCWSSTSFRRACSMSESDVFTSEEEALDALDVHQGWVKAIYPDAPARHWYLQEAKIGRALDAAPGDIHVHMWVNRKYVGSAGEFESFNMTNHWLDFVLAASRHVFGRRALIEQLYSGTDDGIERECAWLCKSIGAWFVPISSREVYSTTYPM